MNPLFAYSMRPKTLTLGSAGGANPVGYNSGGIGSIVPNSSYKGPGSPFVESVQSHSTYDFQFIINAASSAWVQRSIWYIAVQDANGNWRSFSSSDATFSGATASKTWTWGTGSNRVWTSADIGESKQLLIYG